MLRSDSTRRAILAAVTAIPSFVFVVFMASTARSDQVYTNGATNGNLDYQEVSSGHEATEQFTITSPVTLTTASVGLWVYSQGAPTTLDWAIGTTPFDESLGSGLSTTANTQLTPVASFGNRGSFMVYDTIFSVTANLTPGNYYFSIFAAESTDGENVFWDTNSETGGTTVALSPFSSTTTQFTTQETLTLDGQSTTAPEPSVAIGLSTSLAGLGLIYLRQRRAKALTACT